MTSLKPEHKDLYVEMSDSTVGQIVAVFECSAQPYAVAIKQKNNTYYYRFFDNLGYQMSKGVPNITRVLKGHSSENIFNKEDCDVNQPVDFQQSSLLETEQTPSNSAEISHSEPLDTITLTLTFPKGVNALEGEFEANNGRTYKVSVKNG